MGRLVSGSSSRIVKVAGLFWPMRILSRGSWIAPWRVSPGESGEVDGDVLSGEGLLDERAQADRGRGEDRRPGRTRVVP